MNLFLANIEDNKALLTEAEAHHAKRVLRLSLGESIYVTDGNGYLYKGILDAFEGKKAMVVHLEELANTQKRDYTIQLAVAPTKQMDRIEFFLEKAIEIGLDTFHPIVCFHSERRKINHDRLEKIALSAMKQSLKAEKTSIHQLTKFEKLISEFKDFEGQKFIAHCYDEIEKNRLKEIIQPKGNYLFLIGPEGDFSQQEVKLAIENNFTPISLGSQRMRTETAALNCVMISNWLNQ